MTCRLIVLAGPLQGQVFALTDETVTLGRHASNHVVIRQLAVSRHHATLEWDETTYRLIDRDSLHGTFVDDRPIRSRLLRDGDRIMIGDSLLLFQQLADAEVAEGNDVPLDEASTARQYVADRHPVDTVAATEHRRATERLIGDSSAMVELRRLILRIADVTSTVLIDGESGCGKELVARVIHASGARAEQPFIAVNCATLSETLLESELFGHERGAFTGAVERRIGQFERAAGGTLFLDEVGEIPLGLQAKLLRVLQEREIERLGGRETIQVDARVLAATNRDLSAEVTARRFRDDLFYRLNVIRLTVPSLRDRADDISLLAHHFLHLHGRRLGRPSLALSRAARALLGAYRWPGNVRELANAIERAVVLSDGTVLEPEDFPEAILDSRPASLPMGDFHSAVTATKRDLVIQALDASAGQVTRAAARLGLSPNYLHRLIGTLGLRAHLEQTRKG
ncbi:MAG: sigma 54-interacting transcriptional regulator [Acidobacteriota bacterium]